MSAPIVRDVKIFISWSGPSEKEVAEALRLALIKVCAGRADVFVSSQDIPKGERGVPFIEAQLASTDYGIMVLSAANNAQPWINYEGGAMANRLNNPVATILLDVNTSDFDGPLRTFQATKFSDRTDMKTLFTQIARAADEKMPPETTEVLFNSVWEDVQRSWNPPAGIPDAPLRNSDDMLAEIVDRVRNIEAAQQYARPATMTENVSHARPPDYISNSNPIFSPRIGSEIIEIVERVGNQSVSLHSFGTSSDKPNRITVRLSSARVADEELTPLYRREFSRLIPGLAWSIEWIPLLPEVHELIDGDGETLNG